MRLTMCYEMMTSNKSLFNVYFHDHFVLSFTSTLYVYLPDMNDNPPEFASHTYYTTVTESASIGSDIVRVLATSRDSGKNAEITYSIIGGNEHRKFAINPKTGDFHLHLILTMRRDTVKINVF